MPTGLHKTAFVVTLALTASFANACIDKDAVVNPGVRGNLGLSSAPLNTLGEDLPLVEIASEVPTFGGFWYSKENQDQIVVALTDLKDFQRVVAMIPKYLGAHQPKAGYVPLKVGRSFADLARFRASLRSQVFARFGVVSLGVKESANRVEIGISSRSVEPEVRGVARSLGIPDEAVAVVDAPEPRQLSHTLQHQHPTGAIEGGWQIFSVGAGTCTLGIPAIRVSNGTNVFVTNSHCTTTSHGFDGDSIMQPSGTKVGSEILDPATWACGILSCRNADAALILASRPLSSGRSLEPQNERVLM